MAATYTPLATTTLGANAASVTFSSISGSYTDLVLIAQGQGTVENYAYMTFNSDTGSNYSNTILTGTGTSAVSTRNSNVTKIYLTPYYGTFYTDFSNITICNILNYSNSTTYKTSLIRAGRASTGGGTEASVGLWRSTSAITRIDITASTGNFVTGSTFTLYGIKAA